VTGTALSLVLRFDGSVRYGPENAKPQAAAIGYTITAGDPLVEGSRALSTFVSSTHVEFRALVAGARAAAELATHRRVSSVHVRGDAAAVIDAVDPERSATPGDPIRKRRVEQVHSFLSPIPQVTYRRVGRSRNDRAHTLATRAYETNQ